MTCIVGIAAGGRVHMGADSAGSDGWMLVNRADPKLFRNGPFLFGFTTSFRMGQLLRYAFNPPPRHPDRDVMAYMCVEFIDALRACLKAGGFAGRTDEVERGGNFLVGYEGRLFNVGGNYQVGESADGYDAVGCGEPYALGAFHATKGAEPAARITAALGAAQAHSVAVRAPFLLDQIGGQP